MRSATTSIGVLVWPLALLVACGDDGGATTSAGGSSGSITTTADGGASPASSSGDGGSTASGDGGAGPGPGGGPSSSVGGSSGQGGETGLEPWPTTTERCEGTVDEDGDGLIDEDCPQSLFGGVFVPAGVGLADPIVLDAMELDAGVTLPVVQTYRSTSEAGAANARLDLEAIWQRGSTPHLNVEPLGYDASQLADAGDDPDLAADVAVMADAVADALAARPGASLFLTFAAEMNGDWTDWGCLAPATFIDFYRWAHGVFDEALASRDPAIDPRRVRWVFGPNNVSSASCGAPSAYYPGHAFTDYLGMSAYRSGTQSIDDAVVEPAHDLLDDVGLADDTSFDRFIVLQTGTRDEDGDDRDQWIRDLFVDLAADPVFRGAIYFDAADWAVATADGDEVATQVGYEGLVDAIGAAPRSDARLEGAFDPFFWDVPIAEPSYPEIQTLRAAGLTSGCEAAPPRFCPSVGLTRRDAAVIVARVFEIEPDLEADLFDDVAGDDAALGYIQAVATQGLLEGCGERVFCANDVIRREDLARALVRVAGIVAASPAEAAFSDLGAGGEDAVIQALGTVGHVDGCGAGMFCPDAPTARGAAARWVVRVAGLAEAGRLAP